MALNMTWKIIQRTKTCKGGSTIHRDIELTCRFLDVKKKKNPDLSGRATRTYKR